MRSPRLEDQLLCLVVPLGGRTPLEVAMRLRAARARLDALFRGHGAIHYATFTLLPPSPEGTPDPSGPALALTLGVDAGTAPEQTLARLVSLDPATLQDIYAVPVAAGATLPEALGAVLLDSANLQSLSGGFVAARDRAVAQIQAEGQLARHLRRTAASMPAATRTDARRLAAELSSEVLGEPRFSWARQAAPQGTWRAKVSPAWLRLGASARGLVALGAFVLAISTLAMIGFANKLAVAALNKCCIGIDDPALTFSSVYHDGGWPGMAMRGMAVVLLLLNALVMILVRQRRLPLGVLDLLLAFSAIGMLVVLPGVAFLALSDVVLSEPLDLGYAGAHLVYGLWVLVGLAVLAVIVTVSALIAILCLPPHVSERWLVVAGLLPFALGLVALHFVLAWLVALSHRHQWLGRQWYQAGDPWGWQPIDRIAIVVVILAIASYPAYRLLLRLAGRFADLLDRLNRPGPKEETQANLRLHQTAPSITACEAEWVGRTAVMISLTEVRRPYWLFGRWARFFLWAISSLGWHYYSEGKLGGVSSIHHAHWHLVDKGRRLLFCSNYDGDSGGYLDEFIMGRVPLINVIWRWTRLLERPGLELGGPVFDATATRELRFPRTRLWLFSGCRREQQFKAYARDSMLPFQYHFAAYDFPIADIVRSTQLRDALSGPRTPAADALVMRALEA